MKKSIIVIFSLFILFSSASALDLPPISVGGGFEFFGNWTTASTKFEQSADVIFVKTNETIEDLNYGGFLFFDATYAELFISIYGGNNTLVSKQNIKSPPIAGGDRNSSRTFEKNQVSMTFGLLGKYPFTFDKLSIAPLLGLSYQIFFSGDYGDPYTAVVIKTKASDFNTLWLHAGANVNYDISEKLYIKLEALYGIKSAPSAYDTKNMKFIEDKPNGKIGAIGSGVWVNTFTARLGVGYRL